MYCHAVLEEHCTACGVQCCVFFLVKCFVQTDCVYYTFVTPSKYLNHHDTCYVCGELTFKAQRRKLRNGYKLQFGCKVGDKDKSWAPHTCCMMCVRLLTGWVNGSRQMLFAVLIVWKETKDHSSNCYFCLTNIMGITSKPEHTVKYPDLPSAMRPVFYREELPVPKPPENRFVAMTTLILKKKEAKVDRDFRNLKKICSSSETHFLTQGDLNDLVRDLNLFKKQLTIRFQIKTVGYFPSRY